MGTRLTGMGSMRSVIRVSRCRYFLFMHVCLRSLGGAAEVNDERPGKGNVREIEILGSSLTM